MTKDLRQKILQTAKELFARKGYKDTVLPDIASQLNIGKSTLYHYFDSKEDIYKCAVEEDIDLYIARIEQIFNDESVSLESRLHHYLTLKEKLSDFFPVLAQSLSDFMRKSNPIYLKDIIRGMLAREEHILQLVVSAIKSTSPEFSSSLPLRFFPLSLFFYLNITLVSRDLKEEGESDPDSSLITKALLKLFNIPAP
ncbi:MAG: TetR/AcrR family transcriptional regulator [Ignavibacteriales bacterium]|nr:hypothetical protein [Ignavibacteriaceae bacterium]QOJ29726.1 MAG: TetR/AcrR family transcriptional regulator [Ignavibacteriales bacterium]